MSLQLSGKLLDSSQLEDVSALSTVHNKNMAQITKELNRIIAYVNGLKVAKPIAYLNLDLIAKGPGNTNENVEEIGDIFEGFEDANHYWVRARWNGGDRTDRANYTPIVKVKLTD